nr:zinc finger protein 681-like [Leptinotarsa decemlineata]XP_023030458.1 zinc finger protein 681-like [Leptinotarsa decemlineata]XP_023030459.1 zinc finger protein 681-like [Leptinotarsa decemlineata]XP_023030460.1 zinc finger protein 681-like [Leptinotarsa decemlineata]XP_023030461.1 zinc finger protein 681-like [Leptinotarsa decemlineata]
MVRICAAKNCSNTSNSTKKHTFFKFPTDLERAKQWLEICKNEVQQTKLNQICSNYNHFAICDVHFELCMFNNLMKNRLVSGAVPTILPKTDSIMEDEVVSRALPTILPETDTPIFHSSENVHILEESITIKEEPISISCSSIKTEIKKECPVEDFEDHEVKSCPKQSNCQENISNPYETDPQFHEKQESDLPSQIQHRKLETVSCRICLVALDRKKSAPLSDKCHPKKTIKQMIRFCIPHINFRLSDKHFICRKCLKNLRLFVKFIEDFLIVEEILKERKQIKEIEFIEVPTVTVTNDETSAEVQSKPAVTLEHDFSKLETRSAPITVESSPMTIKREISDDDILGETPTIIENITATQYIPHKIENTSLEYSCDMCNKVYLESNKLYDHQKKIHGVECSAGYDCHSGSLHFANKDMESHWYMHIGYCQHCQKSLPAAYSESCKCKGLYEKSDSQDEEIIRDVDGREIDQNEPKHVCEICGRCFSLISDLESHLRLHVESKSFTCDKCSRSFRTTKILNFHKLYTHDKIKSKCKFCGRRMWNSMLMKHYKSHHSKELTLFCKICQQDFIGRDLYKSHLRSHFLRGQKKYTNRSNGDTVSRNELNTNGKRLGRAECEICSLTFSSDMNRDEHKKIHEDSSYSNRYFKKL